MPSSFALSQNPEYHGNNLGPELRQSRGPGSHVKTRRSAEELAGLVRIAHELKAISIRERAGIQPLRQDAERLIAHSQQLIARCAELARPEQGARSQAVG